MRTRTILTTIAVGILLLAAIVTVSAVASAQDFSGPNCDEVASQEELIEAGETYGWDAYDADDDGIACDGLWDYEYDDGDGETEQPSPSPSPDPNGDGGDDDDQATAPTRIETGGGYCATHEGC